MIENRLLRHALALGEHGNFGRAAEALNLTQPSLSRSIAALESSLGVKLFDRTTKGATPTAFGRVLLERGEAMLRSEAGLRRELQLLAGMETGELVVGAGPYYAESVVALAVGRLARMYPRLRIRCVAAQPPEISRAVLDEQVDVGAAAVSGIDEDRRLEIEELPPQRVYLACRPGHPLTEERAPKLPQVLRFPLVTTVLLGAPAIVAASGGTEWPEEARAASYTPPILVSTIAAARVIARESDAVVPGTALTLVEDVASGRLALLDVALPSSLDKGAMIYLRDRTLSPAAQAFLDQLREVAKQELPLVEKVMEEAIRAGQCRTRRKAAADAPAKGDAPGRRSPPACRATPCFTLKRSGPVTVTRPSAEGAIEPARASSARAEGATALCRRSRAGRALLCGRS